MTTKIQILVFACASFFVCGAPGCEQTQAVSSSGVSKATVHVQTGADGLTVEQRNVTMRLKEDNKIGSIKHLYVISAYSGQVILYSTVKGKVTSGSKRLTPSKVSFGSGWGNAQTVDLGGAGYYTDEVLGDDGTYGSSSDYLYWWDSRGIYHQHFVAGGQILHVSNEPLAVKGIVINMESRESRP